jgi:hypothetical protein
VIPISFQDQKNPAKKWPSESPALLWASSHYLTDTGSKFFECAVVSTLETYYDPDIIMVIIYIILIIHIMHIIIVFVIMTLMHIIAIMLIIACCPQTTVCLNFA